MTEADLRRIADAINKAERPVVTYFGGGVTISERASRLQRCARAESSVGHDDGDWLATGR